MKLAGLVLLSAGWCSYLGGVLVMELVWRPVQAHIPPSQTGALCATMGRRYRWMALAALGVTAIGQLIAFGPPGFALAAGWGVLVALIVSMGLFVHPQSHARWAASAAPAQQARARQRRLGAIKVMGALLRIEVAVALLLAASLAPQLAHSPHL